MNQPYVKQYNLVGEVTNPIEGSYVHKFANRRQRRAHKNQTRFMGNNKGYSLTVTRSGRMYRYMQFIPANVEKDQVKRTIKHLKLY